jgi:hypothetical protein
MYFYPSFLASLSFSTYKDISFLVLIDGFEMIAQLL